MKKYKQNAKPSCCRTCEHFWPHIDREGPESSGDGFCDLHYQCCGSLYLCADHANLRRRKESEE